MKKYGEKTLLTMLAVVFTLVIFVPIKAQAASSTLRIKNYSYPKTVVAGKGFNVKGTAISNKKIKKITGTIYKSDGKTKIYTKTVKPNKKTAKYAGKIDNALKISKLTAGKYIYYLYAKDASGKTAKVKKTFTVTGKLPSNLNIALGNKPSTVAVGKSFSVSGTVKSNYKIKNVTATIYNTAKSRSFCSTSIAPNKTSASLSGAIDAGLKFGTLAAGDYMYYVSAKDSSGKTVYSQQNFKVTGSAIVGGVVAGTGGQAVVNYAKQFIGNPYVYGGSSLTNGADCSGFVMSVYKAFGYSLPHSSTEMRSVGTAIYHKDNGVKTVAQVELLLRPGDIMCYSGHVGIYSGNGQMINASNSKPYSEGGGIRYTPINYKTIITVRRIIK